MPIWKINFCSSVLQLSELPRCREKDRTRQNLPMRSESGVNILQSEVRLSTVEPN